MKFYLAPGMRNGKMYLAPNDSFEKFYLAVKGLSSELDYTHTLGDYKHKTSLGSDSQMAGLMISKSSRIFLGFHLPLLLP